LDLESQRASSELTEYRGVWVSNLGQIGAPSVGATGGETEIAGGPETPGPGVIGKAGKPGGGEIAMLCPSGALMGVNAEGAKIECKESRAVSTAGIAVRRGWR
jgi:hypothetical protein